MSSMTFEQKVAIFKAEVLKTLDLPDEAMPILLDALKVAQFSEVKTITVTVPASGSAPITAPVTGGKKISGYNYFTKLKIKELGGMIATASAWKALSEDEKKVYNGQAAASNATSGAVSAPKGSKGLSGWNVYVREQTKVLKAANPSQSSQDRMKEMAATWKALDKTKKDEWTAKAKVAV